jgi:hypothetical protein
MKFDKKTIIDIFFIILVILNIIYFFIGFYYQHDFSNGGKIDFDHFNNNLLLFKENKFLEIPWDRYESTTMPIYYLLLKFIIPKNNIFIFKLFGFSISIIIIFLIYLVFKIKYNLKKFSIRIFLLSSIPLLSSSYRTDSFFGMEKNFGLLFLILGIIFFFLKNKNKNYLYLSIFFSCFAFYTKQIYCFLPILIFFLIIDFKNLFCKKNFLYSFLFLIFLIPSFYFFYKWGGLVPPVAAPRIANINFYNIPVIFGSFLIFVFPLFLIIFLHKKNVVKLSSYKIIFLILFYFFYIFIFLNIKFQPFGGGPIYKLAMIFEDNYFSKIFFLSFTYMGLILSGFFCKQSKEFLIYFLITSCIIFFADNIFFGYLDPLAFIILIFFIPFKFVFFKSNKFILLNFFYFFILHISYVTYYKYYVGNIIR